MSLYNQNAGYGMADFIRLHLGLPVMGKLLLVCPSADANYGRFKEIVKADPEGKTRLYSTLETAYAAATTDANDVIALSANATHDVADGIAWSKNRIHVIGLDGGDHLVQQGAKVRLTGAVATAYVLKVTGMRNTFRNIKFIQGSTNAAALNVLQEGGEGSLYKNCSFIFEVIDNLDLTTAAEVLAGSDSATYLDCTFGCDTLLTSAARAVFLIDIVTTNQEFKSNILRGCTFIISSSSGTATFIRLSAITDILFTNLFDRCNFVASVDASGGAAIAEVVQTGTGTSKGVLAFSHPAAFNCTDFSTVTGGRNAAIQLVGVVTTAGTGGIGVQPTA